MPLARRHQVDRAGLDHLTGADAVAMLDGAFKQIGHRREIDVRVWTDVHALARRELCRAELVDEDERADHRPFAPGQRAVDLEVAEVVGDRHDGLDHGAFDGGHYFSPGAVARIERA